MIFIGGGVPVCLSHVMAVLEGTGCPCADEGQLLTTLFRKSALRGELPTARDVEWLLFSCT